MNFFCIIFAKAPDIIVTACCGILAQIARLFAKRDQRIFFQNIRRIYRLPKHSNFARDFFRQNLKHTLRCQVETIIGIFNPSRVQVEGIEALGKQVQSLLDQKRGLIVITAHLGSWEFVAKYTGQSAGQEFYALAKPAPIRILTQFLDDMRKRMGTRVLWTGRSSLLRDMITTLRSGHILGFVMDQKPAKRKGPIVEFLGQPTEFVTGPASLAIKCKAPVLAIYCIRRGPWRFAIEARELFNPTHDGALEVGVECLTQDFASDLSRMISRYPEQWTWSYKRWSDQTKPAIMVQ